MAGFRLSDRANARIDEIVAYTRDRWGREQAARYVEQLFAQLDAIASSRTAWLPLPKEFGTPGFRKRWRSHVIYWTEDADGILVLSILHSHMDQPGRLRDDLV